MSFIGRHRRPDPDARSGVDAAPPVRNSTKDRAPMVDDAFRVTSVAAPLRHQIVKTLRQAILDSRRSEEHTSELQSLMRISYAVFCLKKKTNIKIYYT